MCDEDGGGNTAQLLTIFVHNFGGITHTYAFSRTATREEGPGQTPSTRLPSKNEDSTAAATTTATAALLSASALRINSQSPGSCMMRKGNLTCSSRLDTSAVKSIRLSPVRKRMLPPHPSPPGRMQSSGQCHEQAKGNVCVKDSR